MPAASSDGGWLPAPKIPRRPKVPGGGSMWAVGVALGSALTVFGCARRADRNDERLGSTSSKASAPELDVEAPPSVVRAPSASSVPPIAQAPTIERLTAAELKARGKTLGPKGFLVNAWASWCGPCKEEFPMLVDLQKKFEKVGIALLFVSVDTAESEAKAIEFAREYGHQGPLLFVRGSLSEFKAGLHPGWPGMLPASFLFDPAGKLRYFWGGAVYESELTPIVEALVRGEAVQGESQFDVTPRPQ